MRDEMFAYMSKIVSCATRSGRFHIGDVTAVAGEPTLLREAIDSGWIRGKSFNHQITPEGFAAYRSAQLERDQRADQAARESQRKMKRQVMEVALPILGTVLASVAAAVVAHWLQ